MGFQYFLKECDRTRGVPCGETSWPEKNPHHWHLINGQGGEWMFRTKRQACQHLAHLIEESYERQKRGYQTLWRASDGEVVCETAGGFTVVSNPVT